ncbi:MAG TPA: SDR family oxidoreductase, partial [Armatimonadota bacterium]|nr:SDR family oxidoreductase [Armatimonadota bacterium]
FRSSAYAASKFGAIGLIQSVALELAPFGARANAICPGNLLDGTLWQNSLFEQYAKNRGMSVEDVKKHYEGQVPLGRSCQYQDITNTVVFLASDASSYMTGQALNVTGGQVMNP